jgi:hypothetical protein
MNTSLTSEKVTKAELFGKLELVEVLEMEE